MLFRRGRRRKILIDKRFQFRFALAGALYIGVIAICLSLPFVPLLNTMRALLEGEPTYLVELVHRQENLAILTFILCTVWLAAAWVLFAIHRSHKVAGPVYKLKMFMNGMTVDKLNDRVTLRNGDELKPLAQALNNMLDRIEKGSPRVHAQRDPVEEQPVHENVFPG